MARPITWQNVNGPSLADASAPMLAAQRSFDNAFGRVREELDRRQLTEDKNYEVGKENNTQEFISELSKFKTPEELQAAQDSGQLDAMRSRFGAQVNRSAINQAQELRPGLLQERITRGNQFTDAQQEREFRPTTDMLNQAIVSGDSFTFNKIMGDNPNIPNKAKFEQAFGDANSKRTQESRATQTFNDGRTTFANQQAMVPLAMDQAKANLAATNSQTQERIAATAEKTNGTVVDNVVRARNASFVSSTNERTNSIIGLGSKLGVPVDKSGMPDIAKMTPEQVALVQTEMDKGGFEPLPTSSAVINSTMEELTAKGVKPKDLLGAKETLGKLINSPGLSPEDALNRNALVKQFDDDIASRKKNNPLYSVKSNNLDERSSVISQIRTGVPEDGPSTVNSLIKKANILMDKGININGKMVTVEPKLLKLAINNSLQADTTFYNGTMDNAEDFVREFLTNPANKGIQEEAEGFRQGTDNQKRKDIVSSFTAAGNTANPTTWSAQFQSRIEGELKKAAEGEKKK
jgi:hypothetical protein